MVTTVLSVLGWRAVGGLRFKFSGLGFRVAGLGCKAWGLGLVAQGWVFIQVEMVISQNRGPQYRPQNTMILIIGTPKMVPLILGNPQIHTVRHNTIMTSWYTARPKLSSHVYLRWTPHPVIVTLGDNRDYIRVLLYSYYATITGWGVLLMYTPTFWGYCWKHVISGSVRYFVSEGNSTTCQNIKASVGALRGLGFKVV